MNTGTMNLGYDDEDFNEIDLRANANKEMGTETYEFLYGAGANATRRLTGTAVEYDKYVIFCSGNTFDDYWRKRR